MQNSNESSSNRDRLNRIIADYLRSLETDSPIDQQQILAKHPDLADDLAARLAELSGQKSTPEQQRSQVTLAPANVASSAGKSLNRPFDTTLSFSVQLSDGTFTLPYDEASQRKLRTAFWPGLVLNHRYVIENEIGRRGMGVVFLAQDKRLDRKVALKVIRIPDQPSQARINPDIEAAFREEARIAANLLHPAIATIFDYGVHERSPYADGTVQVWTLP